MKPFFTYCFILYLFTSLEVSAQHLRASLKIQVLNKQDSIVDASLSVLRFPDSTLVKRILPDRKGLFETELDFGNYLLRISAVGYRTLTDSIELKTPLLQKKIILIPDHLELGTVNISSNKPFIERLNNKTIVHVEQSSIATGSTALEILSRLPGVLVDQNGHISVKGNSGVQVLIDGKSTYLSVEQLTTRLRSLNSTEIKSIELINNPSAKYDAEGNAGIIDIKLKKNMAYGTNGNLEAGFGYGKNPKTNIGISLNHRTSKLNLFGNFNNDNNKAAESLDILRVSGASNELYFHQTNTQVRTTHNNSYKAGLDYFIDKKHTIGLLTTGYFNRGHDTSIGRTNIGKNFNQVDSAVLSDNPSSNHYVNQAYNLNYKAMVDTLGKAWSIDLDYAQYQNAEYTIYNNAFIDGSGRLPSVFRNQSPSMIHIWALRADYSHPFNDKFKLDLGIKSSWVNTNNDFRFENQENDQWINDVKRSNQFIYSENINAAYALFKYDLESTNIEIGVRAEQTNSKGNSIQEQRNVNRSYLNFFPSFSINRKLNENEEIGLSYSRRIDRPDYKSLNPFVYFVDLYTYSQGNAFLNPQYSNGIQFSYSYLQKLNVSLNFSRTKDVIMDVFLTDPSKQVLFQTTQNLASQESVDLSIGLPIKLFNFWTTDNNISTTYNRTVSANLNGLDYNRHKINMMLNTNQQFTLSPGTSAELSAEYASAQIYGTYAIKPYYGIDLGFKKSFLNQKLNFKLALNDVLNSRKVRISSALSNLDYSLNQKLESRTFKLSINYLFGSSTVLSSRERKTSVSEEENRIK